MILHSDLQGILVTSLTREPFQAEPTWYTLDEVGHHGAEVSSDVLEDLCIFVILSFQEHPGQIHILQEQSAQSQGVTFQSPVCTVGSQRRQGDAR